MATISFTAADVTRLAGVSYPQLDYWCRTGLIRPEVSDTSGRGDHRRFSFRNVVEIRVVRRLREHGASLQKIRRALDAIREAFPSIKSPLSELLLVTDGATVFAVVDRDTVIDVLKRGQLVFAIALGDLIEETRGRVCSLLGRDVSAEELLRDDGIAA